MTRWAPWLLAFVVWNGTFDLQVRWAGAAVTAAQLDTWRQQQPPALLRDVFTPQVQLAAVRASIVAATVLLGGLAAQRRAVRASHR